MRKTIVIYGAPGTGKTRALLDMLRETMRTTPVRKIAYVSYTRKGTYQGVDIAKNEFNLRDEECRYFKTLYSIAFALTGKTRGDLFRPSVTQQMVIENTGIDVPSYYKLLRDYGIARNNHEMTKGGLMALEKSQAIMGALEDFRKKTGQLDYNDLLMFVLENQIHLDVEFAFIDEAQDLTPLHWKVCECLFQKAKVWVLAGDPNQSLFRWAGADHKYFVDPNLTDTRYVLDQSYRCSQAVWAYARFVSDQILERVPVPDKCRDTQGVAKVLSRRQMELSLDLLLSQMQKAGKNVYCLAITTNKLKYYIATCMRARVLFTMADNYGAIVYGGFLNKSFIKRIKKVYEVLTDKRKYHQLKNNQYMKKDCEKLFPNGLPPFGWTAEICEALTQEFLEGDTKINKKREEYAGYIYDLLWHKMFLYPPIHINTVHRVKGGECDYAFLDTSILRRHQKETFDDKRVKDTQLRTLFVGITRARDGIFLWSSTGLNVIDFSGFPNIGEMPEFKEINL